MTAGYSLAMAETNKSKKRTVSDPSSEWTGVLVRFLKEQISEVDGLIRSSSRDAILCCREFHLCDVRFHNMPILGRFHRQDQL